MDTANLTANCSSVIETCPNNCYLFTLNFFRAFLAQKSETISIGAYYQKYFINLMTRKDRYDHKLSTPEWTIMTEYINEISQVGGLAGPLAFDLIAMTNPDYIPFKKEISLAAPGSHNPLLLGGLFSKQLKISPSTWSLFTVQDWIVLAAEACLKYGIKSKCDDFRGSLNKYQFVNMTFSELRTFFNGTLKPEAHFTPGKKMFVTPAIPFCWFGYPLYWVGEQNFTASKTNYYKAQDPNKVLKWCNAFERAFPVRRTCFTTKLTDNNNSGILCIHTQREILMFDL